MDNFTIVVNVKVALSNFVIVLVVVFKKWKVETSSKLYSACICSIVKLYNKCKVESDAITGFIQASMSKIQGLFKDFSRIFYSFQGLKT